MGFSQRYNRIILVGSLFSAFGAVLFSVTYFLVTIFLATEDKGGDGTLGLFVIGPLLCILSLFFLPIIFYFFVAPKFKWLKYIQTSNNKEKLLCIALIWGGQFLVLLVLGFILVSGFIFFSLLTE